MFDRKISHSLDEYTLDTKYTSRAVALGKVDLRARITRNFWLNIPFLSAAMQAVTGSEVAIGLAKCGGLGVVPCSLSIDNQVSVVKETKKAKINPEECKHPLKPLLDEKNRLCVGAAINTHEKDYEERIPALVNAGLDAFFIDSADGFTQFQEETLEFLVEYCPYIWKAGGNVINADGVRCLADAGADGIKVGMSIGHSCTTAHVKATGKGQATAIMECVEARDEYFAKNGVYLPIIADGGISDTGTMCIALALGADALMMGKFFAGCEEAPGKKLTREELLTEAPYLKDELDPKIEFYKEYWGEGSLRGLKDAKHRYGQSSFAEGVEGWIPYTGRLIENVESALRAIIKSMKDTGSLNLDEFRAGDNVIEASPAAVAQKYSQGILVKR